MAVAEAPSRELSAATALPTSPPLLALLLTSARGEASEGWRIKLEIDDYEIIETTDVETALGWLLADAPPDIAILDGIHAVDATDRLIARLRDGPAPIRTAILVSRVGAPSAADGWTNGARHVLELLKPW